MHETAGTVQQAATPSEAASNAIRPADPAQVAEMNGAILGAALSIYQGLVAGLIPQLSGWMPDTNRPLPKIARANVPNGAVEWHPIPLMIRKNEAEARTNLHCDVLAIDLGGMVGDMLWATAVGDARKRLAYAHACNQAGVLLGDLPVGNFERMPDPPANPAEEQPGTSPGGIMLP